MEVASLFPAISTTAITPAAMAAGTSQARFDDDAVWPASAPFDWESEDAGAELLCAKSELSTASEDSRTATVTMFRIWFSAWIAGVWWSSLLTTAVPN